MRIVLLAMLTLLAIKPAFADNSIDSSFYATWRLMNSTEKAQFSAGYLHGWKDAASVLDIAIEYVKENPKEALGSLEKLKKVYDMSNLKPDLAVKTLEAFYSDSDNQRAPLSKAMSAARFAARANQTP